MNPPLAHAGHWLVQLAFALPAVLFFIYLGWQGFRAKRDGREREDDVADKPTLDEILEREE